MDQFWIKKDPTDSFRRPQIAEDVRYRKMKKVMFDEELKNALPDDCDFCFHGTTIWNAKAIIESGAITARIDRESGDEILNTPGQIYVTTLNNVWFTIKHHTDLNNYNYPAGCIFVVTPKGEQEFINAKENNLIANVDLKANPDRLKAIITTPENIMTVRSWIADGDLNIDENLVVDFDDSIALLNKQLDKNDLLTKFK